MPERTAVLDRLVVEILAAAKYRDVAPDLIRAIGAAELDKRRTWKEAVKATKNKLHQVAGAYLAENINYSRWLERIATAVGNPVALQQTCMELMALHASTRERLPILHEFYAALFTNLGPVRSVIDLACGLNPLAIAWMPLSAATAYFACDIYTDQVAFLNRYFALTGIRGHAAICDLVHSPPPETADVALLLKAIPCLEQIDKSAGRRLLDTIQARVLFVSFPAQSLGGRSKGMATGYAERFDSLIEGRPWTVTKFEFATELVFRVVKQVE